MANRSRMEAVPDARWARAEWLDENFEGVLRSLPMHEGWSRLLEFEELLFPACEGLIPIDPACPECGVETEDGRIERVQDRFRVLYECGHVLEMSAQDLQARVQAHGRNG